MEEKNHKRPNVFPTQVKVTETNVLSSNTLNQEQVQGQVQSNDPIGNSNQVPAGELAAAEEMRRRTAEEIQLRNHALAQTAISKEAGVAARAELMKEMGEVNPNEPQGYQPQSYIPTQHGQQPQGNGTPLQTQEIQDGAMSYEEIARFQKYMEQLEAKKNSQAPVQTPIQPPVVPPTPPSNYGQSAILPPEKPKDVYIEQLSQPQFNSAYDVIPLPSKGKLYKNKKKNIKIAYMSTADENILTSPNLLSSGDFLEILINRKILDSEIRYRDLIEGDRNAIMLWLRATGYGNMYPVTVEDENGVPFETEVDLNEIKTIELNVEPDINGYFDFRLPVSGIEVKFKLLTVGEIESIAERVEYEVDVLKMPVNNTSTYTLAKQLVSVNGDTNQETIASFSENMRVGDASKLREYIETINCGVDMTITVGTPGGGSITTFLPLNLKFFWPNIRV